MYASQGNVSRRKYPHAARLYEFILKRYPSADWVEFMNQYRQRYPDEAEGAKLADVKKAIRRAGPEVEVEAIARPTPVTPDVADGRAYWIMSQRLDLEAIALISHTTEDEVQRLIALAKALPAESVQR